ncbi:hypothetical protein NRF20_01475 [Streptomyces sp. R-74717]|uniref:hypothetical protein n=1 Tax=Streptomyces sp. R-74717 TaxID=2969820 RepID=UPI0039B660D5
MHTRITKAAAAAGLLATLTACSSSSDNKTTAPPSSTVRDQRPTTPAPADVTCGADGQYHEPAFE